MSRWTSRCLSHPVLLVLAVALAVRGIIALAIVAGSGGGLFLDDVTYSGLAADVARGHTESWGTYEHFLYDVTGTYLVPLSLLYRLFGVSPYAAPLLVMLMGASAAGFTTALALRVVPRGLAVGAGLGVALLPSQVLFSSLALKDAFIWAILASIGLIVARGAHARPRGLVGCACAAGALLFLLAHLRPHTMVVATWAVAVSWLLAGGSRWLPRAALALAVLAFVPLLLGAGVAGSSLIRQGSGSVDEQRQANAVGAGTAFVTPEPPTGEVPRGPASGPASGLISRPTSNIRALPLGLRVMLIDPLPGRTGDNKRLQAALAENIIWWPALVLALVGLRAGWRRRDVLGFPILVGGGLLLVYALAEGNFGTAYRHRGELVWVVALLAATGAASLVELRRPADAGSGLPLESAEPVDGLREPVAQSDGDDAIKQRPEPLR